MTSILGKNLTFEEQKCANDNIDELLNPGIQIAEGVQSSKIDSILDQFFAVDSSNLNEIKSPRELTR